MENPSNPTGGGAGKDPEFNQPPYSWQVFSAFTNQERKHLGDVVAHADRRWKAEEANAARLAARANLVVSGITAVIGLKLVAVGKELDTIAASHWWMQIPYGALVLIAIYLLCSALFKVLDLKSMPKEKDEESKTTSSGLLRMRKEFEKSPLLLPDSQVQVYLFKITNEAATNLLARNEKRAADIEGAQWQFVKAILVILSTIALFVVIFYSQTRKDTVLLRREDQANVSPHKQPDNDKRGDDAERSKPTPDSERRHRFSEWQPESEYLELRP